MTNDIDGVAETLAIERIARVLAAWHTSTNADGVSRSAGAEVDIDWPDHIDAAVAILKVLREPDSGMAAIGDVGVWRHMIDAAILGQARIDVAGAGPTPVRDAGTETHLHGGAWTQRDQRLDETFPASDPAPVNPGVD
jgi:hypothetical protein